jgi:hypothetical protein
MSKIDRLARDWGMSVEDMLEMSVFDGLAPAICMNPGCDYSIEMEPDQDRGWCEECGTNSVKSIAVLMGII